MKLFICFLLLIFPKILCAQNDGYVMMKNSGTLCFTPSEYMTDGNTVLHIMQDECVGIYDNDIVLKKNIDIPAQTFTYRSSSTRRRNVLGVVRSELDREEELTDLYVAYAANCGKDFTQLTHVEQQKIVLDYEARFNTAVEMREEDEFTLFISLEEYNNMSYFNYPDYKFAYPKVGVLLDKNDGKVYRFMATYSYEYSAWGDYEFGYDTIVSQNNILSCISVNAQGNMSDSRFFIASTLFNDDEEFEYMRPIYTLVDAPVYSFVGGEELNEQPITSEGEFFNKELAIKGFEIVSESGKVVGTIDFGVEYSNIGNFQLMMGTVVSMGSDISVLQLGSNRFLSFDTYADEMGSIAIYKHFYKINVATNSIEVVNAPVCIKVIQSGSRGIDVECDRDSFSEVELFSSSGQSCAVERMTAGKCHIKVENSGTYLLGIRENGALVGSKKIFVK